MAYKLVNSDGQTLAIVSEQNNSSDSEPSSADHDLLISTMSEEAWQMNSPASGSGMYKIQNGKAVFNASNWGVSPASLAVEYGQIYRLRGVINHNNVYPAWIQTDENNNVISNGAFGSGSAEVYDDIIVIDKNAKWLYANSHSSVAGLRKPVITRFFSDGIKAHVPEVFRDNIDQAVEKCNQYMAEAGRNGASFISVNDLHLTNGHFLQSPQMIQEVFDKTSMDLFVDLGDCLGYHAGTSIDTMRADYLEMLNRFRFPGKKHIRVLGNHDENNLGNASNSENWETDSKLYHALFKVCEDTVTFHETEHFTMTYYDKSCDTLYLCLDTGTEPGSGSERTTSDVNVVANLLKANTAGHVIILSHRGVDWWDRTNSSAEYSGKFQSQVLKYIPIFNAYNAKTTWEGIDFSDAQGKIEIWFNGHLHYDRAVRTTGGLLSVSFMNDGNSCSVKKDNGDGTYSHESYSKIPGTLEQHSINLITVDYEDRKCHVVRVGFGEDMDFDLDGDGSELELY